MITPAPVRGTTLPGGVIRTTKTARKRGATKSLRRAAFDVLGFELQRLTRLPARKQAANGHEQPLREGDIPFGRRIAEAPVTVGQILHPPRRRRRVEGSGGKGTIEYLIQHPCRISMAKRPG